MKKEITIEEIWEKVKRNFKIGKDYIESETEDYIVFCPFNYCILCYFDNILRSSGSYFYFSHCVCHDLNAFCYWYRGLYQDGRLKTFFIRKDIPLRLMSSEQKDKLIEFTGWIDFSDRNFLHFAHDVNNQLITGFYHKFEFEYAYSRKVTEGRKNDADKVNKLCSKVYDDLFAQYDAHINELEETLHNILDE